MKNLQRLLVLFALFACNVLMFSQSRKNTFDIKGGHFLLNGKAFSIHSGEMHYPRIPQEYWKHRLQMMKAMGLNAVTTYVFWNYHEESPGKWNWSGEKDLKKFIKTAQEVGLYVIIRPGPYVCAEWEFGGYPWWLQNIKGLKIREDNDLFLAETKKYLSQLYTQVKDLQITNGGPVIMIQAENEFGSFVAQRKDVSLQSHRAYNAKIVKQLKDIGFNVPMFTSDGSWLFEGGSVVGALPTANGEDNIENLKKVVNQYNNNQGPYMVAEFYPGWLAHWAEKFPRVDASTVARQTDKYLKNDVSFNYYMIHGGTNFGFTSGANYDKNHDIQPDLTSYDYDAPITEAGWRTPKYDSLRAVIGKYTKAKLPEVPAPIKVIEVKDIKLNKLYNFFNYAEGQETVKGDKPQTFEELNQGHGYVLYRRHFNQPISGTLDLKGLRDYATVYINGEKVGELNRYYNQYTMPIDIPFNSTLEILVENWGRINYGAKITENTKGIISPVKIGDTEITGNWEMTKLPFPDQFASTIKAKSTDSGKQAQLKDVPTLYQGEFDLQEAGDTFIDMQNWGKGVIFINGRNIGRFWRVGPQQTLYIPGVWLKKGKNEIIIFDQLNQKVQNSVSTVKTPILDQLVKQ
ncbi:beta-galactosidase [Elizabethkingia meningoseptica]|uniref:glycoside hydrolase family 35 protein n=1 Tax=Elizabethkingia meningoseptica TaxID=238 RepID=UPI0023AFD8D5|nr:beta-galactosidase family protein [Elizabethkingia meningoseptica]MDE5438392.1 beta-galactosidase [Elizabethkingia meningoseptica]MDE5509846.1 beta-galactosidase [Elizabethkingia meningoseptica]MDE5517213.1 beta-galactosidase [Elizabethkingia meningoseptica]MDE5527832.1 beta-galactosidase [Elizabethkingia meningoseptica]MDE5530022.1 beta-galactosidase [Elizabethkingia meningoseptica]